MTTKEPLFVTVSGVRVQVLFGEGDRPTSAGARIDRPGDLDSERIAALAAHTAFEGAKLEAQRVQRKGSSVAAAAESARKRAKASVEHWTNEWLANAHAAHPDYGKDRLAQHARRLAAADPDAKIGPKKRDEISVERARKFLDRKKSGV